jgi:TPR repeat protein
MYNYGDCLAEGVGVKQDIVEAAKWYRRAADDGHAKAQVDFAVEALNRTLFLRQFITNMQQTKGARTLVLATSDVWRRLHVPAGRHEMVE